MSVVNAASRYRRVNLWMREHWVASAFAVAIAIAVGFGAGTVAYGGSHVVIGSLAGFIGALAVGLPVRRRQARRVG